MYWILFVMGAIAAAVIALIVGGLVTPRRHAVARSIILPDAPDAVWRTVRDVARYHEWRHDLEDTELVDTDQPQLRWRERDTRRSFTFGLVSEEPPHRFTARLLDDDLPYHGEWTWQVAPEGRGTRVTLSERGDVGNPIVRFIRTHVTGYTKALDRYLRALAAHHGDRAGTIDIASVDITTTT